MLLKRGVDGSVLKPDVILERNTLFLVCEVRGRSSHEKKDRRSRLHCVCATLRIFFLAPVPASLGI